MDRMVSRRIFLAEALAAGSAACVPNSGQEAPTPHPLVSPTIIATPEAPRGTDMFYFGNDVPPVMQQEIRSMVGTSHKWFLDSGIPLEGSINVFAYNKPDAIVDIFLQRATIPQNQHAARRQDLQQATAWYGGGRDIYIITGSPGWNYASPIIGGPAKEGRMHTLVHEKFHVFQGLVGVYNREPIAWINEGSGHYVAALFLEENKIYDYDKIRNGHLGEAAKVNEPLQSLEGSQSFYRAGNPQTADEYSLAFLALEFLCRDLPGKGLPALVQFWKKVGEGLSFKTALEGSFGKPNFYQDFEDYRKRGFKS